jgi:hypothetical protein
MRLDSLEQVSSIDVGELVVPNLSAEFADGSIIDVAPKDEGRLSVSEDHIQEGQNSVSFSFFLSFLRVLVVGLENTILKIHSVDVLQASGCDLGLEDLFEPRQSSLLENSTQMVNIEAIKMDELC